MQPLQHVMNAAACIIMDLSVCNHAKPVVKLLSREFCTSCVYMCTLLTPDTTTILRPFFRDHPGWAGARRELLVDFMVQGEINRGRHTDHPAGRHSIRTNQCPHPPSPIFFFGPGALPAAQPTMSKHWRHRTGLTISHQLHPYSFCSSKQIQTEFEWHRGLCSGKNKN